MGVLRSGWASVGLILIGLAVPPSVAAAERRGEPAELFDQATAAFGLGHYEEAAQRYEEAFSLQPDPVLLYDAAQSYRLAGNKRRALELYRNLLRIYPDFVSAQKARDHIAVLQKELDEEKKAASPPPMAAPPPAPAPVLVGPPHASSTQPDTGEADQSIFKKAWFWGVVGAVVIGGTVGVLLATRGTQYPNATLGTVTVGNKN